MKAKTEFEQIRYLLQVPSPGLPEDRRWKGRYLGYQYPVVSVVETKEEPVGPRKKKT